MNDTKWNYRLQRWPNNGWTVQRVGPEVGDLHPLGVYENPESMLEALKRELMMEDEKCYVK